MFPWQRKRDYDAIALIEAIGWRLCHTAIDRTILPPVTHCSSVRGKHIKLQRLRLRFHYQIASCIYSYSYAAMIFPSPQHSRRYALEIVAAGNGTQCLRLRVRLPPVKEKFTE